LLPASSEAVPNATALVINNNSQEEEKSKGGSNERKDLAQRFICPMLFSGPEKPQKHKSSKIDLGECPMESWAKKAGWALSETRSPG
jgi:hypothetical protein